MRDEELISVIVPIYNVERYLRRCIDSIIYQSYENIEIILVDDGSSDSSGDICEEYKERDKRVCVIHKENGGLSDARNVGIDIATGKYLTFIDSDDYVSISYIEELYNYLIQNKADIAVCSMQKVSGYLTEKLIEKDACKIKVWNSEDALRQMLLQYDITCNAWGKLYISELFKNIRYPKGKLYEDLATTYKLIDMSNKIVFFDKKLYAYYQRIDSIQNSEFSEKKLDEIEIVNELVSFVEKKYPRLKNAVINRKISSYFHVLFSISDMQKYDFIAVKLREEIKKDRTAIMFARDVNKKVRIGCLLSFLGFVLTRRIYNICGIRGTINL